MTPERFRVLQQVFDEAADLPAAEQAAYLRELKEQDPELAGELARLLSRDAADAGEVSLKSVVTRFAASLNTTSVLRPGQSIGPISGG